MLNLKETPEHKVFVTSDLHLGHRRDFVWKSRGFDEVDSHDKGVIDSINAVVRPADTLLFLGDFCLNTTIEKFNEYLGRIQCQNILSLWGNHNNPHEKNIYRKAMAEGVETYPFKYRNMTYMGYYMEVILNKQFAVLFHYPIYIWNEMSHGAWMLCGHSHGGCPMTTADSTSGKILDVGWDEHKRPWSLTEIATVMDGKQFAAVDNHHIPSAKTQ